MLLLPGRGYEGGRGSFQTTDVNPCHPGQKKWALEYWFCREAACCAGPQRVEGRENRGKNRNFARVTLACLIREYCSVGGAGSRSAVVKCRWSGFGFWAGVQVGEREGVGSFGGEARAHYRRGRGGEELITGVGGEKKSFCFLFCSREREGGGKKPQKGGRRVSLGEGGRGSSSWPERPQSD